MSNVTPPFQTAFELQRRSVEHGERLFQQSLDVGQEGVETFLRNGFAAQRSLQRQGTELSRRLVEAQFEAFRSALDDEEVQSAFDRQFEDLEEIQRDGWDGFENELLEAVEDLSAGQREVLARSVQAFLDAQDDVERRTVEGVRQSRETAAEFADGAEEQTEATVEAAEATAEVTEDAAADVADEPQAQADAAAHAVEGDLEDIEGLGSTYGDRLRDQGIESITHLAQANVETIAADADVSESQAEEWVQAARSWT